MTRRQPRATVAAAFLLAAFLPAHADEAALKKGTDALAAGKGREAVKIFSAELDASGRTPAERARALYLRAKAQLASGQPALAFAFSASASAASDGDSFFVHSAALASAKAKAGWPLASCALARR